MAAAAICPPTPYIEIDKANLEEREGSLLPKKRSPLQSNWFVRSLTSGGKKDGAGMKEQKINDEKEHEETGSKCFPCFFPIYKKKISPTESVPLKSSHSQNNIGISEVETTQLPSAETTAKRSGGGEVCVPEIQSADDSKADAADGTHMKNSNAKQGLIASDDSSLEDILLTSTNEPSTKEQEEQGARGATGELGFALQNGDLGEGQPVGATPVMIGSAATGAKKGGGKGGMGNKVKKTVESIQKKLSRGFRPKESEQQDKRETFAAVGEATKNEGKAAIIATAIDESKKQDEAPTETKEGTEAKAESKEVATPREKNSVGESEDNTQQELPPGEKMQGESKESSKEEPASISVVVMETTPETKEPGLASGTKNCVAMCKEKFKKFITLLMSPVCKIKKRVSDCWKSRRAQKEQVSVEPLLPLEKGVQAQETVIDRSRQQEREIWSSVSKAQLKAVYATIATSVAKTPREKLMWLGILHRILEHKASRHDVHDSIRGAAINGNIVTVCLHILEEETEAEKAQLKMNESTIKVENELGEGPCFDSLSISPDNDNLTMLTIQVLQESVLNDAGVLLFRSTEGPRCVAERLRTWKALQNKIHQQEEPKTDKILDFPFETCRAVDALKAVYALLFATSGEINDCSNKWAEAGIAQFPKLTLSLSNSESPFVTNSNYVGLALGALRVLESRGLLPKQELPQLIDLAIEKFITNSKNSWISENALALLALTIIRHPVIAEYINDKEGIDIWKIIVERCEAMQSEGHVLYQGLLSLKEACNANPGKIVPRVVNAGAVKLVESILPVQENKYVEHLITTAIKLKQLMSPYDFEKEELQSYIRSKSYHKGQALVLNLLPLMPAESSEGDGDVKSGEEEEGKEERSRPRSPQTLTAEPGESVESNDSGDTGNKDSQDIPDQVPKRLSLENLEKQDSLLKDFDG